MQFLDRDISCYNNPLIIKYAQARGISEKVLFKGIEEYYDLLTNPLEWADARVVVTFVDNFRIAFGGSTSSLVEAATEISKNQISFFQLFFLKISPLELIARKLTKHAETNIAKSVKMSLQLIAPGKAIYRVRPDGQPGKYSKCICAYNKGCAIGVVLRKGLRNLHVKELSCAATTDAEECIYEFTYDPDPPIIEKLKSWFFFRFRSQDQILAHMESAHQQLQKKHDEIKSLQEFYSHLMANMGEAVVWCDKKGIIGFSNPGFLRISGLDQQATTSKYIFDIARLSSGLPTLFIEEKLNNDALLRNYPLPGVSGFSSYIAIPLNIEATCIAIVQIFMPEYQYNKRENALLITLAAHAAICLSNAIGLEKLKEKARLDGELKAARLIQYRYTPHHTPPIPRITLKGVYLPAYEVGGDYLDYFQTEKGNWVIIIADICGKGIPAALMMTMLRSTFRVESKYVDSAKDLLCAVNNFFSQNLDDSSFATASCLVINNDGTRMKYARAGHLNLIHFDKSESKLKTISARGIALGLVSEAINYSATIDEIDIPLQTGDKFLLYTDGLIDTIDPAKREYGYNRLNDVLLRNKNADAEELISSLMKDIKEFASGEPPRDDLTILALEVMDGKSSDLQ